MEIHNDYTDISKVNISEDLYKKIISDFEKIKDDEIDSVYAYKTYAFGKREEKFDTYLEFDEDLELTKLRNLYTLGPEEMDSISSKFWRGYYALAAIIYHTDKNKKPEDNYKDYLSKFNFYNARIRVLSVIVSEEDSNIKLDVFEHVLNHNECYRRKNLCIRTSNDKDIPINEYVSEKQQDKLIRN